MEVGAGLALMNVWDRADEELYRAGLALAEQAEHLGFDSIWTVEHHFTGHSPVPNALQLLTYLAGRTARLKLGTAVITLPWHHPLRVAEEIAVLDILSQGRLLCGFGRGTGAVEYAGFQVPMEESRERFAEGLEIVLAGLTRERFSYHGRFFDIPELSVRPRSTLRPHERFYGAAVSPESAELMGRYGLGLLLSPQRKVDGTVELLERYRASARRWGHVPRPPIAHMYVSISHSRDEAWERARRYMRPMFEALDRHYEFSTGRLYGVKGYEHHAEAIEPYTLTENFEYKQRALEAFIDKHLVGTPQDCLERLAALQVRTGLGHFVGEFSYGGMPYEECAQGMRLFAERVVVELHDPAAFPRGEPA